MELGAYKKRTAGVEKDGHLTIKQEPDIIGKKSVVGDAGDLMVDSSTIVTDLYKRLKTELARKNTSRNHNSISGSNSTKRNSTRIVQGSPSSTATTTTSLSPTTSVASRSRKYRTLHHQEHHRTIRDVNRDLGVIGGGLDSSQLEGGDIPVTAEVTIESTSADASGAEIEVAKLCPTTTNILKNASRMFDVERMSDETDEIRTGPTTIINHTTNTNANSKRRFSETVDDSSAAGEGRLEKHQDGNDNPAVLTCNTVHQVSHPDDDGSGVSSFKSKRIKYEVDGDGNGIVGASVIDQIIDKESETMVALKDLRHDQMEASHVLLSLNNET